MAEIAVGYVQYKPEFGLRDQNLQKLESLIRSAGAAELLVLPELAATGYEFRDPAEVESLAETFGSGPTSELLRKLSGELGCTLVAGYPELTGEKLFNSCMLFTPDGRSANYRKIHLFSRENELFSPGDAPPPVVETPAGRIGLMICFDWFFPEVARILALKGAQILAHPSNLVLEHCQRAMYARCVENRVFAITANRIGNEERAAGRSITFTGASQILDIFGRTLVSASTDSEHVAKVTINPALADDKQLNPQNHLFHSRRTELYSELLKPR